MQLVKPCRQSIRLAVCLLALCLSCASVRADVGDVLYEDDFSTLDPVYDVNSNFSVKDNVLSYPLDKNLYSRVLYQANLFEAVDLSAKVRLDKPDAEKDAVIGIAFWALDANTFYTFMISDYGTYAVFSVTPTKWLSPVSWRKSSAIKTDPGEWNELRVVTVGNRAVLYINGEKVASIKGKAPAGGSLVGVYRQSAAENSLGYFSAFKVVEPDPKSVPQVKEDPNVILQDGFAELDPGWGSPSSACDVKDGALTITAGPAANMRRAHSGSEIAGDVDISVKISMSKVDDTNTALGGLTFFEVANDDYWMVNMTNDGQFMVGRWAKTRWLFPVPYRKIPEQAKWVQGEPAELKLSIRGKKLGVSINGHEVVQTSVQVPKDPWQIGVYVESGTLRIDDLLVARAASTPPSK